MTMLEGISHAQIMEAYVERRKRIRRGPFNSKGNYTITSLSPIRRFPESHTGHVPSSLFGGNKHADNKSDKWWKKEPVIAGESQTLTQKRLSILHTESYRNKSSIVIDSLDSIVKTSKGMKKVLKLQREMAAGMGVNRSNSTTKAPLGFIK